MTAAAHPPNEVAAEWVSVDVIHPWANNPRDNEKTVAKIAKSIKRFGFSSPIIARKADGEIIAGHTRYKAAIKLGLKRVPVRFLDLDPAEAHVLALADNKLGEDASWDKDLLQAVTFELKTQDADLLDGTGFTQEQIDELLTPNSSVDGEESGREIDDGLSYSVVVECDGERAQAMLIEKLEHDGFRCKPVMS
jgi:ParB family transcriptional regulator, chromosome partitioning protein